MEFLGALTQKIEYYIPSRFDEGYGLNSEAIRSIYENGAEVLLTVDCGSVSYAEVELAKKLGKGKTVVTVLPDTAERYFSTPLFDE